jgi:hypothetical protein
MTNVSYNIYLTLNLDMEILTKKSKVAYSKIPEFKVLLLVLLGNRKLRVKAS